MGGQFFLATVFIATIVEQIYRVIAIGLILFHNRGCSYPQTRYRIDAIMVANGASLSSSKL